VVAADLEPTRDDLDPLDRTLDSLASPVAVLVAGKLHANQELRGSHGTERDIRVAGQDVGPSRFPPFERDQRTRIED